VKINKDFYKEYSIIKIRELFKKKKIKPKDLINFSISNIKANGSYNFLTNSSFKSLKFETFLKNSNFDTKKNLSCIPFLAKDIFNTIDFKTEMGSKVWKNFNAGNNARVIDKLVDDGSILMGKSTTAEFAVHHETKCKNAIDNKRLPGTSSTGSAVAVSLGVVPYALGTQTAGSITRPASYNGVYGIKPTFGMIPRTGILKTCDSLDTIGFLTSNFENIKIILNSMRVTGKNYPYVKDYVDKIKKIEIKKLKIGFVKTHTWNNLEDYNKKRFLEYINRVKGNFITEELNIGDEFNQIHEIHKRIYYKSLSYYFKREKKLGYKLSSIIKDIIKKGNKISNDEFKESIFKQNYLIEKFDKIISNFDLVISPGTAGIAPKKTEIEKNDSALMWTFLHVPSIFSPIFKGPKELPFGIQFIGRKWNDLQIISILEIFKKKDLIF
tara:strand:+ start:7561 stop:8877 length:1317 start_codon:yes stop_codon:yes gene_type:complete